MTLLLPFLAGVGLGFIFAVPVVFILGVYAAHCEVDWSEP